MNIPGAPDQDERPVVGGAQRGWVMPAAIGGAALLGAVVFMGLNDNRTRVEEARLTDPVPNAQMASDPVPEPPILLPPPPTPIELQPALLPEGDLAGDPELAGRLKSPVLVVDLSEEGPETTTVGGGPGGGTVTASQVTALASGKGGEDGGLNADEAFATRLAGTESSARAGRLDDLHTVVPQGALIAAVLETAINSDLPGYTRAVVSRDVRGFSGEKVLIPRGSRLIGQYRSGVALGQSRAFVIWTRLIRPDGVTMDLGSPGADAMGRGGLEGKVNRHFLRRFGGAIVLSLISAAASNTIDDNTQVIINSSRGGLGEAAAVALEKEIDLPPTIEVPQGSPIRVFVARDLDFSAVEADEEQ